MHKQILSFSVAVLGTACTVIPVESSVPLQVNAQEMVQAHNTVRSQLGLPPMHWSPELAQYAQDWANHLAANNACRMQHRSHAGMDWKQYGENLYWGSPERWSDGQVEIQALTASRVASDWASEWQHYDYASNSCRTGEQCGHYTQMVWRDTAAVGCAAALCSDKAQLWVCNYNPPGNWIGQQPY